MDTQFKKTDLSLAVGTQLPEVVVYENIDFWGWNYRTNLDVIYVGDAMNDKISSFIVVSGKWQFFKDSNFQTPYPTIYGPGYYHCVEAVDIPNDQISSFKCVEL